MTRLRFLFVALLLPGATAQQRVSENPLSINKVQMLSCDTISNRPCFRVMVSFSTALRNVPDGLLPNSTAIEFDRKRVQPFYVSPQGGADGARKPRTVMILVDISRSMDKRMSNGLSRFDVAKQAVDGFVSSLDSEIDRVAVVPFDNHGVRSTISAARFSPGGEEARGLVAAIPSPRGDTALYAAISFAIDALEQRQRTETGREYQLIVITDGIDDLGRDPDPELRQHPVSIDEVALKTEGSSISVYPIGIGRAEDNILGPLERISFENSHLVQEPDELIEVLARARPAVATGMQVTFLSPYATAGQLEGRNHMVRVLVGQPGPDQVFATLPWAPPESMIAPQAREECSRSEKEALSKFGAPADDYTSLVRPLATLAVFACIWLLCWYLMPRLIWPERFSEELPKVDGGARWSAGRQGPASKVGAAVGGIREETDATYVMPRQESDPRSRFK